MAKRQWFLQFLVPWRQEVLFQKSPNNYNGRKLPLQFQKQFKEIKILGNACCKLTSHTNILCCKCSWKGKTKSKIFYQTWSETPQKLGKNPMSVALPHSRWEGDEFDSSQSKEVVPRITKVLCNSELPMLILNGMATNMNFCLVMTLFIIIMTHGKLILKSPQVPLRQSLIGSWLSLESPAVFVRVHLPRILWINTYLT